MRLDQAQADRGANDDVPVPTHRANIRARTFLRRCRFLVAGLAPASLLVGAALVLLGTAVGVTAPARQGIGLDLPLQSSSPEEPAAAADAAPVRSGHAPDAPPPTYTPAPASAPTAAAARPADPVIGPDEAAVPSLRDTTATSDQPDPRDGVPPLREALASEGETPAATAAPAAEPTPPAEPDPDPGTEPDPGPEPDPEPAPAEDVRPALVALPTLVEIPRIGVRSELIDLHLDARGRLEVPRDPALAGWWTGGPRPGQDGAAVIVGHVDSVLGPAVFHGLPRLEPGDEIVVHRADGTRAPFAVERVERWPKDAFPTQAVYREAEGAELRLITCGGRFDQQALRYLDNVIVFAAEVAGDP